MQQESGMSLTIKIGHYGEGNRNDESIKFETKVIKSLWLFRCIYSCSKRYKL